MEIVNHEYYVSLEVAKLLKEAGFDWETRSYYTDNKVDEKSILLYGYNNSIANWNAKQFFMRDCDGSIFVNNGAYRDSITGDYITSSFFSAPTLDVAQKWLREVKGLHICVKPNEASANCKYFVTVIVNDTKWGNIQDDNRKTIMFDTYEEAQEAGIKKALEIILEKGE